jgi:hypothetical protein
VFSAICRKVEEGDLGSALTVVALEEAIRLPLFYKFNLNNTFYIFLSSKGKFNVKHIVQKK